MIKFKDYIKETTITSDIANYDTLIGHKGNSRLDFIELIIKNDEFLTVVNKLVSNNKLSMVRKGDLVTIEGPTEIIKKVELELIELGIS